MKATSANLLTLIQGPKQFVIPIYQRTYSWHKTQCEQLFKDILRISKNTKNDGHFIGSVVYFEEDIHTKTEVPVLQVIDGQQRFTTITLLIAALAKFIKENEIDIKTTAVKLQNYYLFNAEEENELRYKLLLTRGDKETLMDILKGVNPGENKSLRITENFEFFKNKINLENAADIYNGLMQLYIVDVALEKEKDNPQLIFESLNSTGLDLSQADLIRNYVLMGQAVRLQTNLYEKYWFPMEQSFGNEYTGRFDPFMRNYLTVKTDDIPKISHVYEAFKQYIQSDNSPENITDLLVDIHRFSKFYVNMVLHKEPDVKLNRAFKRISRLKVDVSYPFLLAVYNDYTEECISGEEFYYILNLVENYVFRRAICGIPTNSLNKTFAHLYKSIRKENYLQSVKALFLLLDNYKRFPADAEFEKEITAKDLYNFRNRNYLLARLENHNRKEVVNVEEYTIEHIMPQNSNLNSQWQEMLGKEWQQVQKEYLHTLGNLTLTGYNSELSHRGFTDKKNIDGGFNDSPIRLNDFLRKTETWNAEQIQMRAKDLADKAKEVWFAPHLSPEELEKYKPHDEKSEKYTLDHFDYLKGEILKLYQALKKRILNIDSSVTEEYKKRYIAFKSSTNFVDIVPQKARLQLSLNMGFGEIIDPKGLCKDVSALGRWGNGDVEVGFSHMNELEDILELIQQAFDKQV